MGQLLFAEINGMTDIADSALASGLTESACLQISHNAKAGITRCENIPMGFYGPGDTVPAPTSPVDGYAYSYAECWFIPVLYSSRQPAPGYTAGQVTPPALDSVGSGTGSLIVCPYTLDINNANGKVTIQTFWSGNGAVAEGTVKVLAVCQRSSVNLPSGVSGD